MAEHRTVDSRMQSGFREMQQVLEAQQLTHRNALLERMAKLEAKLDTVTQTLEHLLDALNRREADHYDEQTGINTLHDRALARLQRPIWKKLLGKD